jgi:hypothetical protein
MPYCAHCGWRYEGAVQFCRRCGRALYRSPGRAQLEDVAPAAAPAVGWRSRTALVGLGLAAGAAFLAAGAAGEPVAAASFPLDEAWVRLVYARALAQAGALEFNSGLPDPGVGSLLWTALLAALIKTLGALGISVIALAKGVSLAAGAAAAALAGELAGRLTGSRPAALAAGGLVALDPTFAFAAAGGVEATLLAALLLGASVALLAGRSALGGILLALAILTRLEAVAFAAMLGLAAGARQARRLWQAGARTDRPGRRRDRRRPDVPGSEPDVRPDPTRERRAPAVRDWRRALTPSVAFGAPLAATLLWLAVNGASTAWMLPRPPDTPVPHLPSPTALWRAYVDPWVGPLGGGAWLVGLPTIALGLVGLVRARGTFGLALGLFAPLLALGAAAVAPLDPGPWPFALRHRVDPALPFLAILLVVGVRAIWLGGRAWAERGSPPGTRARRARAAAVVAASLVAAAVPAAASLALWAEAPGEYRREAAWLATTYVEAGRLIRDGVPEEALVAALTPGAVRYVSRRPVADLTGQHTPAIAARDPVEALAEARAQFATLPAGPTFESLPSASLLRLLGEGSEAVGVFRVAPGAQGGPREAPYAFPLEALRRLDYLDVGNEASERSHGYVAAGLAGTVRRSSRVTPDAAVDDDGRRFAEGESFELQVEPGRDLLLARRYDATATVPLRLTVDGQPAAEWTPRAGKYLLAEETIRVPAGLIRRPRVNVGVQVVTAQPRPPTSFAYWAFADR